VRRGADFDWTDALSVSAEEYLKQLQPLPAGDAVRGGQ
jgi:hypothetical protein